MCFTGALNPANLAHGWASPFGATALGAYGPHYILATSVGLGWLAARLIQLSVGRPGIGRFRDHCRRWRPAQVSPSGN